MTFRPLHDRVALRRLKGEEKTKRSWSGAKVESDGDDILILEESDILGVVG